MADGFRLINADEFKDNPFTLIGNEWMLITAGTPDNFNTMTASWGGMGRLWDRNVCFIFVRPTRYTYEFMEKNETFSLSFSQRNGVMLLYYADQSPGETLTRQSNRT